MTRMVQCIHLKMEAEGPIRRPIADVHAKIARSYRRA